MIIEWPCVFLFMLWNSWAPMKWILPLSALNMTFLLIHECTITYSLLVALLRFPSFTLLHAHIYQSHIISYTFPYRNEPNLHQHKFHSHMVMHFIKPIVLNPDWISCIQSWFKMINAHLCPHSLLLEQVITVHYLDTVNSLQMGY